VLFLSLRQHLRNLLKQKRAKRSLLNSQPGASVREETMTPDPRPIRVSIEQQNIEGSLRAADRALLRDAVEATITVLANYFQVIYPQ